MGYAKLESQVVENSIMGKQYESRSGWHVQSAGYNSIRLSAPAYKLLKGESLAASLHNQQNRSTSCFSATQGELYIIFLRNQAYTTSMRFVKGFSVNMHITGSTGRPYARPDNSQTFSWMPKRIRQQIRNCEVTQIAIDVNNGI